MHGNTCPVRESTSTAGAVLLCVSSKHAMAASHRVRGKPHVTQRVPAMHTGRKAAVSTASSGRWKQRSGMGWGDEYRNNTKEIQRSFLLHKEWNARETQVRPYTLMMGIFSLRTPPRKKMKEGFANACKARAAHDAKKTHKRTQFVANTVLEERTLDASVAPRKRCSRRQRGTGAPSGLSIFKVSVAVADRYPG